MSYSDFKTLDQVNKELGIVIKGKNELYINVEPVEMLTVEISGGRLLP